MTRYVLMLAVLASTALMACSGDPDSPPAAATASAAPRTSTARPSAGPASATAVRSVRFEPAFGGRDFDRPTELGVYPGGRFFLADQSGLVILMGPDGAAAGSLLDIRSKVLTGGSEEGFLSLALDPEFPSRPYIYTYYSAANPRRTVLSRFEVEGDSAVLASELVLLEVGQPFANHNGGAIRFGPDGMLYLGLGDGGSEGDPNGNAQDLGVLLGKILRLDVRHATAEQPYAIPPDNPFAGRSGARPEIWAYGFRNPWRMAFDPATGRLWVGDVGASTIEEVDIVERGGNYGWNRLEGNNCYSPRSGCDRAGTIAPVATYTHEDGCSITGGFVYRGTAFTKLAGSYIYTDFCSGKAWVVPAEGGGAVQVAGPDSSRRVASFATDEAGDVYLLNHGGPVLRIASVE